jgi:putative AlgH/UPF0301 family transcriptional regulator
MSKPISYLGQLLCANPQNPRDGLDSSVILIVSQTSQLAIGIQLNRVLESLSLSDVAANLDIDYEGDESIYYGGNIGTGKIHVVHSADWAGISTIRINQEISVTSDPSIISSLAAGQGPEYFRACAGFWIWDDNHLEIQMDPRSGNHVRHRWETATATISNIFEYNDRQQWLECLNQSAMSQINQWF